MPGNAAKVTFLRAEFLDRLGRDPHQEAVHELLVASKGVAQLGRHGRHGVKIVARQQFGLTLFEPLFSPCSLGISGKPGCGSNENARTIPRSRRIDTSRPPSASVQQAAMSARALFCEGIITCPYCEVYLGPNRRTTSASSTPVFVRETTRINHGSAPFPRRGRRWSGGAVAGDRRATVRSGGCRSPWIVCSNARAGSE